MREIPFEMRILEKKHFPGLAALYLAQLRGDPRFRVEFVDTLEPAVSKERKWVMMISTQFGCPVGCLMCDAGSLGYQGNLSAEEMLVQIRHILSQNLELDPRLHPKIKIHFARMGEPALNPEVLKALRILARELPYPGILPSLSTVAPKSPAVAPFFEELIAVKESCFPAGRFQLQFSLHSADAAKRKEIIPVKTWALEEIASYGERFVRKGDRKITLNFALPPGETADAEEMARAFPKDKFLIKITPVNPTDTADKNRATFLWQEVPEGILENAQRLREKGFEVLLSPSLPEEISAATSCGQLWSQALKAEGRTLEKNREREISSYLSVQNLEPKSARWMESVSRYQKGSQRLNPDRCALVVIDMQEFFLNPRSPAYLPPARAIASNAMRLLTAFRKSKRPVLYTVHAYEDPSSEGGLTVRRWKKTCLAGTPEAGIFSALRPGPGERVFRKTRYSAFSNPEFERFLREQGIEELVLAGVMTHLCVESTAREAFSKDFQTTVLADAAACPEEDLHLGSLRNLACGFSRVIKTSELLAELMPKRNGVRHPSVWT